MSNDHRRVIDRLKSLEIFEYRDNREAADRVGAGWMTIEYLLREDFRLKRAVVLLRREVRKMQRLLTERDDDAGT